MPDSWLVKLLRSHKVMPDWILTGQGQQYCTGTNHEAFAKLEAQLKLCIEDYGHLVNRIEDNLVILTMTDAELARRKEAAAKGLAVDHKVIQGLQAQLSNLAADTAAAQTH